MLNKTSMKISMYVSRIIKRKHFLNVRGYQIRKVSVKCVMKVNDVCMKFVGKKYIVLCGILTELNVSVICFPFEEAPNW